MSGDIDASLGGHFDRYLQHQAIMPQDYGNLQLLDEMWVFLRVSDTQTSRCEWVGNQPNCRMKLLRSMAYNEFARFLLYVSSKMTDANLAFYLRQRTWVGDAPDKITGLWKVRRAWCLFSGNKIKSCSDYPRGRKTGKAGSGGEWRQHWLRSKYGYANYATVTVIPILLHQVQCRHAWWYGSEHQLFCVYNSPLILKGSSMPWTDKPARFFVNEIISERLLYDKDFIR